MTKSANKTVAVKAIIFDMDNTLWNWDGGWFSATKAWVGQMAKETGVPVSVIEEVSAL